MEEGAIADSSSTSSSQQSGKRQPGANAPATTLSVSVEHISTVTRPNGAEQPPVPSTRLPGGREVPAVDPRDRANASPTTVLAGWISLAQPHLLPLAIAPVLATVLALWDGGARVSLPLAVLTVLSVALMRAGAGALISVRDATLAPTSPLAGIDAAPSLLARAGVSARAATIAGGALLGLGVVCGLPVALAGGPWVWGLAVLALALLALYRWSEAGVRYGIAGEVLAAAALGPGLAMAVGLSQVHHVSPLLWLLGGALGVVGLAVTLAEDLRDLPEHLDEGRRTLSTMLGDRFTTLICAACLLVGFVFVGVAGLPLRAPHGVLLAGLAIPAALVAATSVLVARRGMPRVFAAREVLRLYSLVALWLVVGLFADGIVRHLLTVLLVR